MKEIVSQAFKKRWTIKKLEEISEVFKHLHLTEKIIFYSLIFIFVFSGLNILKSANEALMVEVPNYSGSLHEGIVGTPRYINPIIAISDADRDMTTLIYSGLLKYTADGDLINDLAENYTVSDDGLTYTFTLKPDLIFHDGVKITTDDLKFTIDKVLDPTIKSPKMANWKNIKVNIVDDRQIEFILPQPYPPFLSNLTIGILPKHLWKDLNAENFPFSIYNTEPVGSGPYKIGSLTRDASGIISYYALVPFDNYTQGEAYIKNFYVHFYPSEAKLFEEIKSGLIESAGGLSPDNLNILSKDKKLEIKGVPLTHIYGFFLNQSQNQLFTSPEIRTALNDSLDRSRIVTEALAGYGDVLESPIPNALLPLNFYNGGGNVATASSTEIIKKLSTAGWKLNKGGILEKKVGKQTTQFSFTITTLDTPELRVTANIAKENWEALGASVDLKFFEIGDLNQNIIRTRKYDVLLLGEVIGRDLDFYGYWHSSQRTGSGLNLSGFANKNVDKILEDSRKLDDKAKKAEKYLQFEKEIKKDLPAIFAYSHKYLYVTPTKLKNFYMTTMTTPSERFLDVSKWYVETENVWKILIK
ncbi:MAG: ABC transporter substrate-binding protein [Minisyncoccia bacterium]